MRPSVLAKAFFIAAAAFLLTFAFISYREGNMRVELLHERNKALETFLKTIYNEIEVIHNEEPEKKQNSEVIQQTTEPQEDIKKLKYILQWTNPKNVPFVYMGSGQSGFIEKKCPYTNCYVTGDRNYLGDITKFDVIAFSGPEVVRYSKNALPDKRSPRQKYAFTNIESADNYPLCNDNLDNFFNWTWTYKLDSDARWGYIVVRDAKNTIIGPNTIMHWIKLEDMDPVLEELKIKLEKKSKAAAWFVSNCYSRSKREEFVKNLQEELAKYDLGVDIYGRCGPLECSRSTHDDCVKKLDSDYYFYLSFENSFSEDYVTEKLLHGLQNNAVPIVYGGANYTRFMPDGIYLNARELGVEALAEKMRDLINHPEEYQQYFRWKKHYSYYRRVASVETDDYCRFCSMLNNKQLVEEEKVYTNFRKWWTPPGRC